MAASSSKPVLYGKLESPTVRTVVAVSRIIGFEIELKNVDLSKQEQLTPEFLKINPFHCVPTIVDTDGFILWESRAIATYLIQSRAPGSALYPVDLKTRATVDKFLYYDTGKLVPTLAGVFGSILQGEDPTVKVQQAQDVLKTLDNFLTQNGSNFIAGTNELSVADLAIHFTLSYLEVIGDLIDQKQFPAIDTFNDKVKQALKPYQSDGLFDQAQQNFINFVKAIQALKLAKK